MADQKKEVDTNDDDYELLPHKDIIELKKELEKLKKGPTPESRDQMEKLTDSINNLLNLFKEASSQMHLEEQEGNLVSEKLGPIEEKLDQILDQNQKIAEGIVALADLIKEMKEEKEPPMPRLRMGPMQGPMPQGPPPGMPRMPEFGGFPPMPPPPRRR